MGISIKMKFFVATLFIGLALGAPQGSQKDRYETVPYTVVATHHVGDQSFEERNYEGGVKWVCTRSKNENIDMTTPVSTKWKKDELHEECFYLNSKHQANPPEPNSPDVYIVSRPAMTIFTRKISKNFWHHMTVEEWEKESDVLDAFIRHIGSEAKSDEMYINGYTDPFAFNQRSELWKIKI